MSTRKYRSPRRVAAAQETRARLLSAASELLAAPAGARAFSLEAVAKAAGVTRLTVYNQFGSRRALLEAVFDLRAELGGFHRIAEVMSDPDALAGLRRMIAFFCEFWDSNRESMAHLHATSVGDPDFEESMRARNERRRVILNVLITRLSGTRRLSRARSDVVDMLFVLTSFHVFSELATRNRTAAAACRLIELLAMDALKSADLPELLELPDPAANAGA